MIKIQRWRLTIFYEPGRTRQAKPSPSQEALIDVMQKRKSEQVQ
jgi:hypothetical protein